MNTVITAKAIDLGSEWTNFITTGRQKSVEVSHFVGACKEETLMNEIHFRSTKSILFRIILLSSESRKINNF